MPHGMMAAVPFNVTGSELNRYDKDTRWWSTPYDIRNKYSVGFAHGALSGVGCPEMGAIITMATVGDVMPDCHDHGSTYSDEVATPGYYATTYDNHVGDEPGASWTATPSIWRWAVVGVVAAAFLVLVFLGLRALYRATSSEPAPIDETTAAALGESAKPEPAATAPVPDEKAKLANAGRTPMDIPPLYVD